MKTSDELRVIFSQRLIESRKSKGLTQKELADKLGIIKQNVNNWENRISLPSLDTALRLAEALDVSVAYLAGQLDDPTRH